jgi:hypothetical protein
MTRPSRHVQRVLDDPSSKRCLTAVPLRTPGIVIAVPVPVGVTFGHTAAMATKGVTR